MTPIHTFSLSANLTRALVEPVEDVVRYEGRIRGVTGRENPEDYVIILRNGT